MRQTIAAVLIVGSCVVTPGLTWANHGVRDAGINERQHRLEQRIEDGRRTGELTRGEYRRLREAMHDFQRVEHYYRSDGHLTPRERHDLHARLEHLAREVYREKHDSERRYGSYNYGQYSYHRPY